MLSGQRLPQYSVILTISFPDSLVTLNGEGVGDNSSMAQRERSGTRGLLNRPEAALGFLLNQAAGVVRERTAAALAPLDIHPRVLGILLAIQGHSGITQTEAGRTLRIDRTTMSQLVNELVERKLVNRVVATDDRRNQQLTLTAQGARTLHRAAAVATAVEDDVMAGLTASERAALKTALVVVLATADENRSAALNRLSVP